jgi:hypothetical protein
VPGLAALPSRELHAHGLGGFFSGVQACERQAFAYCQLQVRGIVGRQALLKRERENGSTSTALFDQRAYVEAAKPVAFPEFPDLFH